MQLTYHLTYPYDVVGGTREIKAADFDDKIDILPVADPNIFSQTQRINLAQTEMQLAMSNPQMHNLYQVYRTMYEAIGVKNIDLILPPPQPPTTDGSFYGTYQCHDGTTFPSICWTRSYCTH